MDSGLTEYKAALDALFARTGSTSKFGLDRTFRFLEQIGNPQSRFDSFHVAGTNGKGSVVATLSALIEAKGYRVGRYMSPHLIDFRERIVVDGRAVSEENVVEFLDRWSPRAEQLGATFFEITTAMAFQYFAECKVDVAVIEAGLGGRLDSTNVIDPLVAAITSIGLDHQEYLGDTEAAIAREKAGIFKKGKPAVIGPLSREAYESVYRVAEAVGSPLIEASQLYGTSNVELSLEGTSFDLSHAGETIRVTTGLVGYAQAANTSVALAILDAAGDKWRSSLAEALRILPTIRLAGRFQRVGNLILDVAHNGDGIRSVVATLQQLDVPRPITTVLGVLADKDWPTMILELTNITDRLVIVAPPSAPPARAWDPTLALQFALGMGLNAVYEPDFERAMKDAAELPGTILVTGSFHTVGDVLLSLGQKTL